MLQIRIKVKRRIRIGIEGSSRVRTLIRINLVRIRDSAC
jgi:hypothetical protein